MMAVFAASGFLLATWGTRLPALREAAGLSPTEVGLVVSSLAAGTLLALLLAGQLVRRFLPIASIKWGAATSGVSLVLSASFQVAPVIIASAFLLGLGNGIYDVASNVRGGRLGHELGRRLLPSFHGCWSLGALAGAGCAVAFTSLHLPLASHLLFAALLATRLTWFGTVRLPDGVRAVERAGQGSLLPRFDSWRSRRTVALGLLALGAACAEGAANEWLTLSLTDQRGFGVPQSVAATGSVIFILGMVTTRLAGDRLLRRCPPAPALAVSAVLVSLGTALIVLAGSSPAPTSPAGLAAGMSGLVLWGVGAALGVPLAMEGAAARRSPPTGPDTEKEQMDDDEDADGRAPGRVSVVLTIGFAAFLPGPLLISSIGERFGYLWTLLLAPGVMVPAFGVAALLSRLDERAAARQAAVPVERNLTLSPDLTRPQNAAGPSKSSAA